MADENVLLIAVKLAGTAKAEGELQALSGEVKAVGNEATIASKKSKSLAFNAGLLGAGLNKLYHYGKLGAVGLLAAGVASAVAGSNFEQQMAQVHAVTNANISDMKKLSDTALHEATITRFSATQAAEGMYRLGRAGFSANQVLKAIPGTLNLAHASAIDMATAAQIQAETLRAFGLRAGQAGMVADVLAKATQGGATSMQELGDAMKYMGATAFGTGQNLQDMVGLLKGMALHAVRGSTAGTTLRQALSRLVNPQKQTSKGLALMGIEAHDIYDSQGLKALPKILTVMHDKMKLLDPVSRKTAISQAFGIHALGGMMALFNQMDHGKGIQQFIDQMNNSSGTAQHMADILNDTVQMKLLRFWHTLETIGIRIFGVFSPAISKRIGDIDDKLGKYSDSFQALSEMAGGPGNALLWILDDIVGAHGRLIRAGHSFERALRTTWKFIQTVVFPVAKDWAKLFAGSLYLAVGGLVKLMALMNRHTTTAKFLLGLLITMYINWKIITLTVVAAKKLEAAWLVIVKFRTMALWVATKLMIVATKAWAVAQWLLNVAMDANPIMLIVLGIIALAAGFYLAYTRVKWFHDAVDKVWHFIKQYWPLLAAIILGPFLGAPLLIYEYFGTIKKYIEKFGNDMTGMWDWIYTPFKVVVDKVWKYFKPLYDKIMWVVNKAGLGGGSTMPRDPASLAPTQLAYGGAPGTSPAMNAFNNHMILGGMMTGQPQVNSPANTSRHFLAARVTDPVTPNPESPLLPKFDGIVHAEFKVDGKTLVDAYAKAKSDKSARRGG